MDSDTDNDGLIDGIEVFGWEILVVNRGVEITLVVSDPGLPDTDGDGYPDPGNGLTVPEDLIDIDANGNNILDENEDIDLTKIDDLLSGKVVNLTENQAAFHPKYRKNKGFINEFIKSDTDFAPDGYGLKDEALINFVHEVAMSNAENIVSLGIGGSYEGPKLLIESLGIQESEINLHYKFLTGSDIKEFIDLSLIHI